MNDQTVNENATQEEVKVEGTPVVEEVQDEPAAEAVESDEKKNESQTETEPIKGKSGEICPECDGRGLKDENTLCTNCEGSGTVK